MSLSRRGFVRTVGIGAAAAVGGRILGGGRVIGPWTRGFEEVLEAAQAQQGGLPLVLLHNNENPLGPGDKALSAMRAKLTERGIPTARYSSPAGQLVAAIAAKYGCKTENVIIGCGSTQILRSATFAFAAPSRPLVGGSPTYEECGDVARLIGASIKAVPGTRDLRHDLDAMADAAKGAGLVFFDNPSNPAATLQPASAVTAFLER
ncbi:MAG TPA: aminotransferase class I/II-fold pyridoxal phosphate-dependent enzyme, partial [Vicinamibacterales bacterium]|nr:aminotransferase class I/II-fold pyridoxal phosphate-dependent enzyme [Vicinamibacterales bacterium]